MSKSEQMARVRSSETRPELLLRRSLWGRGLRYRLRPPLPGTPDLAFARERLAVFVDGCFWHGCPDHYKAPVANSDFWAGKLSRNIARDRAADDALVAQGWTVHRVWEHDVERNLEAVASLITSKALARRPPMVDRAVRSSP